MIFARPGSSGDSQRRCAWLTFLPCVGERLLRLAERAVRAAPADDEHVARLGDRRDRARRCPARRARPSRARIVRLLLVVLRRVGDVAGERVLLDAADAVLEARRAGDDPRARERALVALVDEVARPDRCGA